MRTSGSLRAGLRGGCGVLCLNLQSAEGRAAGWRRTAFSTRTRGTAEIGALVFEGVLCGGPSGLGGVYHTNLGSTEQRRRRRRKCDRGLGELPRKRSGKKCRKSQRPGMKTRLGSTQTKKIGHYIRFAGNVLLWGKSVIRIEIHFLKSKCFQGRYSSQDADLMYFRDVFTRRI